MNWLRAVEHLRVTREAGVLVTIIEVRGHAPRAGGAKMVVSASHTWDSVGGGNLEEVATRAARAALERGETTAQTLTIPLSDRAPFQHGVQCCGGDVTLLIEPLAVVPAVAVFGFGHVGSELARILARQDLDLHLVDSRPAQLASDRMAVLSDAVARVHVHHVPVLPELVLGELPTGTHVLIMTHDHAEDAALCDSALRTTGLGSIGLIGSTAKWTRFRRKLLDEGHRPNELERITTPIGIAGIGGKDPATIAISVAAWLSIRFEHDLSRAEEMTR